MRVCLVRHAVAYDRDASRWPDDSKRPLEPEGRKRFEAAARGLLRVMPEVDLVLSSPFVRAWQTASIVSALGWPEQKPCPELEPERDPAEVLEVLRELSGVQSVALFGHRPNLHAAACHMIFGRRDPGRLKIKKGGALLIEFGGEPGVGEGVLRWSLPPGLLRELSEER